MDILLAIAFDGIPFPTPSDGTDVTSDLWAQTPITCNLGRDQARQQSPAKSGTMIFELNNTSRAYSPENTGSPYYPNVKPPKDVRLSTVDSAGESLEFMDGTDFDFVDGSSFDSTDIAGRVIFTGRMDNAAPNIEWGHRTVGVSCLGMLSRLVGKRISTQLYQDETIDQLIGHLLDEAGWPADARLLNVSYITLPFWWLDGGDAFGELAALVNSDGAAAYFYEDGEGNVVFKNHMARTTETRSTVSQATYSVNDNIYTFNYEPNYKDVIVGAKVTQVVRAIQPLDVLWSYGDGQSLVLTANQSKVLTIRGNDPFLNALEPSATGPNAEQLLTGSVTLTNGTFIANVNGVDTSAIAYNASAATIQAAFETAAGSGNVLCGGSLATGLRVQFRGDLKEKAIPLITITSSLNTGTAPATIQVLNITDGPDSTYKLYPSLPLSAGSFKIQNHLGNKTAALGYNATAGQIQTAIENQPVIVPGDVSVTGGPINTTDTIVEFTGALAGAAVPLTITDATSLRTTTAATATIIVTETVKGGGPDYMSDFPVTFSLDRDNGPFAKLTITAGIDGATLPHLQVRAQQVAVIRTQDVSYPEDLSGLTEGVILTPTIRQEISLEDAEALVLDLFNRYSDNRPVINLGNLISLTNSSSVDAELQRQVGDRITIEEGQTGVSGPYFIEQKQYEFDYIRNVFTAVYGCERVM